jgi:hypothetical protein
VIPSDSAAARGNWNLPLAVAVLTDLRRCFTCRKTREAGSPALLRQPVLSGSRARALAHEDVASLDRSSVLRWCLWCDVERFVANCRPVFFD